MYRLSDADDRQHEHIDNDGCPGERCACDYEQFDDDEHDVRRYDLHNDNCCCGRWWWSWWVRCGQWCERCRCESMPERAGQYGCKRAGWGRYVHEHDE